MWAAPIRPRTEGERRAYIAGHTQAIIDADAHGLEFARAQLRVLAESEGLLEPEAAVSARKPTVVVEGTGWGPIDELNRKPSPEISGDGP